MLLQYLRTCRLPRASSSHQSFSFALRQLRRQRPQCLRWQSTVSKLKAQAPAAKGTQGAAKKLAFPQRLLVYHAGTSRTVFVGCTKVSTFFVFGFFCTVIAPSYYANPDEDQWLIPAIVAAGAIPMLYVAFTTKPFVTYVHLVLPETARVSREALMKWLNTSGRNMELDFTTMRFIGLSRTTRVRMQDLKRKGEGATDISNLVIQTAGSSRRTAVNSIFGVPKRFHVGEKVNHSNESKLWKALHDRIPQDVTKKTKR